MLEFVLPLFLGFLALYLLSVRFRRTRQVVDEFIVYLNFIGARVGCCMLGIKLLSKPLKLINIFVGESWPSFF
jgi:hypothetical protein